MENTLRDMHITYKLITVNTLEHPLGYVSPELTYETQSDMCSD